MFVGVASTKAIQGAYLSISHSEPTIYLGVTANMVYCQKLWDNYIQELVRLTLELGVTYGVGVFRTIFLFHLL